VSGGKPNSLDYPNILNPELEPLLKQISFVCPNKCGEQNIDFLDLHQHMTFFCAKGTSENKQEVIGRLHFL